LDYIDFIGKRVADLRIQKNVSARDMSLSLGQGESYINKIENHHTLPSIPGLIYICEYFGITPMEFFNADAASPNATKELINELQKLTPEETRHIIQIVNDIQKARDNK